MICLAGFIAKQHTKSVNAPGLTGSLQTEAGHICEQGTKRVLDLQIHRSTLRRLQQQNASNTLAILQSLRWS